MYAPIFETAGPLAQTLDQHIHQIAAAIRADTPAERLDILGGKSGRALFFALLGFRYPEHDYTEYAFTQLEELIDALGNTQWSYDMGTELSGAALVLQLLQNNGIIDENDDLGLDAVDTFVCESLPLYTANRNWDPILGITTMGVYLLERFHFTGNAEPLQKLVEQLLQLSTVHKGYHVWVTPGHHYQPIDCLNFGLAHGMPGLISFLAQVYAAGICRDAIATHVNSCIDYLLSEQNPDAGESQFPSYILTEKQTEETRFSRLGWCYGDLGPAFALLHWGHYSEQPALIEKGLAIAEKTTRRDVKAAACTDAPFCHGSAGLAHQYNRIFRFCRNPVFQTAARNWAQITIDNFYHPGKGIAGYPFLAYREKTQDTYFSSNASLLEGAAGVGLAFASLLPGEMPAWDSVFFTNLPDRLS